MKRLHSVLRSRSGMTLVEMVVGAALLCLVIGIFSASLRPAAEVSRRTQELNNAELIADDLLETVRSKVETATEYIKCYDNGSDVTGKSGTTEGSAIEFQQDGFTVLLTTDGYSGVCRSVGNSLGDPQTVKAGYLTERYYKPGGNNTYTSQNADGTKVARDMTRTYPEDFYMGLCAAMHFAIDQENHTVTASVTIYRGSVDEANKLYSDEQIIDLRYDIRVDTGVTATKKTATSG